MNAIHKLEHWGDTHHPAILDLLRITLGVFLFLKGYGFMINTAYLGYTIESQHLINLSPTALEIVIYYVTFVHLAGGILIAMGLLTRLSSILQLPIVFGAIFFINIFKSSLNSDLWLSIFACVLLVMFAVLGSGPISLNKLLSPSDHKIQ